MKTTARKAPPAPKPPPPPLPPPIPAASGGGVVPPPDHLHTMEEAQRMLGCKRSKIYSLARQNRLRLVKFDRSTRVTAASLYALLREIAGNPANLGVE